MEFNDPDLPTKAPDAPDTGDAGKAQPIGNASPQLPEPTSVVYEAKKIDLVPVAMPIGGDVQPVTYLGVRELKGVGQMFTANMENAFQFRGIVYKPVDVFEPGFQVVAGEILHDPRIMKLTRLIAFIPAYSWATFETVLMPVKMTSYGQKVLADLNQLQHRFPKYKAFVQWDETRRRHVVYQQSVSEGEAELIGKVSWPAKAKILDALALVAFDTVKGLSEANEDLRNMLTAREVG